MKTKRAIIIDAHKREVREDEFPDKGSLESLQKAVEGYIELVRIRPDVELYVNEEGLMQTPQDFFTFDGYPQPLAGNGVIFGGKFAKHATLDEVRAKVKFVSLAEVRALLGMGA